MTDPPIHDELQHFLDMETGGGESEERAHFSADTGPGGRARPTPAPQSLTANPGGVPQCGAVGTTAAWTSPL